MPIPSLSTLAVATPFWVNTPTSGDSEGEPDPHAEIYRQIPDFGGFLVKANSEGQPGPQDYGRTHADGANMLADVLAPHEGIVMWRAFVNSSNSSPDRIKEAMTSSSLWTVSSETTS